MNDKEQKYFADFVGEVKIIDNAISEIKQRMLDNRRNFLTQSIQDELDFMSKRLQRLKLTTPDLYAKFKNKPIDAITVKAKREEE